MSEPDQPVSSLERWDPFAGWTTEQMALIRSYERLLVDANRKVNLVSRATIDDAHDRHIVHSLAIAVRDLPAGATVVDWGTGGGLPGIPLAIRFPNVTFHLVDSILKKTRALEVIRRELGLTNVTVHRLRAEDWTTPVDYAVSRATAPLVDLWRWTEPVLAHTGAARGGFWSSGLLALKGGDLREEIAVLQRSFSNVVVDCLSISELTGRPEMKDKSILHLMR